MENVFILLLAGEGKRLYEYINEKKQFFKINDQELFLYPLLEAVNSDVFSRYVLVVDYEDEERVEKIVKEHEKLKEIPMEIVDGGKDRNASVSHALQYLKIKVEGDAKIFIHDADRVLVKADFLRQLADFSENADAITPAIPLHDSILKSTSKRTEYLDRRYLYMVQTPQVFDYRKLLSVYENGFDNRVTDDYQKALDGGLTCQIVRGDVMNFKLTDWDDLNLLIAILQEK